MIFLYHIIFCIIAKSSDLTAKTLYKMAYEDNKDKMSPEEITLLEAEIESAQKAIEEYKAKWL